jgi:hypothetical protein
MMKKEVLVGLLRATLQGKVTNPESAASWLNETFGEKYGIKMTPKTAQPWLEYMPVKKDPQAGFLSDEELELLIIEGSGLFPVWEAARFKRRKSAVANRQKSSRAKTKKP